jgi:hypothetical protein
MICHTINVLTKSAGNNRLKEHETGQAGGRSLLANPPP